MKSVAVISLGCDKNRIDTEHMLYRIVKAGYAVSDVNDADVIIVNTCAFIESAREESIDNILQCAQLKKTGNCKKLIVTGCLPQKHREELVAALPEVDAFLGAFEYDKILAAMSAGEAECETAAAEQEENHYNDFYSAENCGRVLTTLPHTAYIKVAEGCNNKCTFCTIPSIRGVYRSRPVKDICDEAERLVGDGVKELILVAQDVSRYGQDIGASLIELLTELEKLPVSLIRLLYCYPEQVTDELIEKIATSSKIAKYIDVPIQHCSDKILKLMNRKTTGAAIERLITKLHKRGIVVRTTLMVGFPGETQKEFDELCSFVSRVKPEYAGVFAYSKEEGTPAAWLPGQVAKPDKLKRVKALGKICASVTREFNASLVGKRVEVLYEDVDFDKNRFVGRAAFQAPDVDGQVYFTCKNADVGNFYEVEIQRSDNYDLYGKAIEPQTKSIKE
ncbi:MAG: 30S ribosomal protein S12 methylthiotransferase RimO [Clostridiales bacterium]|nr:30S ribosomal protein S12 methylthiotransferase RimO [Clostridiales bacterium]